MREDEMQSTQTLDAGTVAWYAAVGGYRIVCTIATSSGGASTVSVVENGERLEHQELATGEADQEALRLRHEYEPRITGVAKRVWRFGRDACLTTSWLPRVKPPEDPPAA